MVIEVLIRGDYFFFTVGNLTADTSLAILAILSWLNSDIKGDLESFIFILTSNGLNSSDTCHINAARSKLDVTFLNELIFDDSSDKSYISNKILKLKKIKYAFAICVIFFVIGLMIQALAIIYAFSQNDFSWFPANCSPVTIDSNLYVLSSP